MRSSWVCWWLLLAWALLLGQPVSGEEKGFEAVPSEGSDNSVETGQPESAMEPKEAEEPEPELEQENLEEPDFEPELTTEEELEQHASFYRDHLEEDKRRGWTSLGHYKYLALSYMQMKNEYEHYEDEDENEEPKAKYMHLEDSTMTIQKAIGNMLKFRMFLKKGDCPEERMNHDDYLDYILSLHRHPWRSRTCQKLDCVFTVFQDVRMGIDAVIDSDCHPLMLPEEMHWRYLRPYDEDFPPPLDDYTEYTDLPESSGSSEDTPDMPDSTLPISDDDTLDEPPSGDDDSPSY